MVIKLSEEQTIAGIKPLRDKLLSASNAGVSKVRIEAGEVEQIDAATLQLLCAFMLEGRQRNFEVEWGGPLEALLGAARLLGVSEVLRLNRGLA